MQSQSVSSPCCPLSGMENQSTSYIRSKEDCGVPCCGKPLANTWENERDHCGEGKLSECFADALVMRTLHVVSWAMDMVACTAAPFWCAGGAIGSLGCCLGSCCCFAASCCYVETPAKASVLEQAQKTKKLAFNTLANSGVGGCCLMTISAADTLKLPANVLCPEIVNLFCFQQELNRGFDNTVGCCRDYYEECYNEKIEASPTPQPALPAGPRLPEEPKITSDTTAGKAD